MPHTFPRYTALLARLACLLPTLLLLAGCATVRITEPGHTATELMLMSGAARKAIAQLDTASMRDRKVYVDTTYFDTQDQNFAIAQIRAHLLQQGVRLVDNREDAQIILEVRSGGIGIDRYDYLLGLPPIFLPVTAGATATSAALGNVITPEIAIFKSVKQQGYAEIAYVAYWKNTGEIVASSGPYVGRTNRDDWWFFGVGPKTSGNIPTIDHGP